MRDIDDDDLEYHIKGQPSGWTGVVTILAIVFTILFTLAYWEDIPEEEPTVDAVIFTVEQPSNYIDK